MWRRGAKIFAEKRLHVRHSIDLLPHVVLAIGDANSERAERVGLFGPSMGLTPAPCALRGQPFGCPNLFRTNLSNRVGSHRAPFAASHKKTPKRALRGGEGGIVRPIHGPHPCALRAPGPAFGCPNLFQTNLSNRMGPHRATLSATHKKTPARGVFLCVAERVGFEPTVRLHVRLISSQVHSTTLPPLRKGARGSTRAGNDTCWTGL